MASMPPQIGQLGMPPQMPQGGQMPMQQEPQMPLPTPVDDKSSAINELIGSVNISEKMDEDDLNKIGEEVVKGYEADLGSREGWERQNDDWMKLALQVAENKTFPWPNAANVKYPLLTTAALQFGSRAYPSLVPSFDVVKAKVIGTDESGQGIDIASKISSHMSYQVLYEMDGWEEDMDKLCLTLPIIGCAFKKTYYSTHNKRNCSELIFPKDLVINYWAKSLEKAFRKTQKIWLTPNEIIERQRLGLFKEYDDIKFGGGTIMDHQELSDKVSKQTPPIADDETPRLILEQHTFYDMDEDDYKEPYIITVDFETKKVLRITARFDTKGIELKDDGKTIACIKPKEYFTQFNFIPNPEGGIYGVGFGLLLSSINESANTGLNQLIDAGTLSNMQGGFLAKGLRLGKAGDIKFTPGEWKWVNSSYDDLKKGIVPLPVRDPSNVLFQLLGTLIQSGKELASIAEIFTGKMPGQNTPASTTMATIEQGLKVFTSIYKRIYRSLGKEFEKLFDLNATYLAKEGVEFSYDRDGVVVDGAINRELYKQAKVKIVPSADPNMVSETQKLILLQGMQELAQFGNINPRELTKRGLEMQGQPGITKLMEMPEPSGPPPEIQLKMDELEQRKKEHSDKMQLEYQVLQSESLKRESESHLNLAKAASLVKEDQFKVIQAQLEILFKEEEIHRGRIQQAMDLHNAEADRTQQGEIANAKTQQGRVA
jgi:chaperonin GroES